MNGVRRTKWLGLSVLMLVGGLACAKAEQAEEQSPSRTLSADRTLAFSIDAQRERLMVTQEPTGDFVASVPVGKAPARVALGADGTIYVSNRGSRSVSVIEPGAWREQRRIPVGVEPVGMAAASDGRTLYVVNAGSVDQPDSGSLMAVALPSGERLWEIPVGKEPRDIRLLSTGKAWISLYMRPEAVEVDLRHREVRRVNADLHASR